jgi:hypothetical protein
VFNELFTDVSVTAVATGRRTLMGRATGQTRATFSIPWEGQSEVRFILEAFGEGRYTTSPVYLVPGDFVELRVRDPLSRTIVVG